MIIRQASGGSGLEVVLEGAYAPDQGITLPSRRRLDVSMPPGADKAIIHDQGVADEPFTVSGELCDAYHGTEAGGAYYRARTMEKMHKDGFPVRVTWTPTDAPDGESVIDRLCIIEDMSIEWSVGVAGPIRWQMRLVPTETSQARPGSRPQRREDAVQSLDGDVAALVVQANAVRAQALAIMTTSFGRAIASVVPP